MSLVIARLVVVAALASVPSLSLAAPVDAVRLRIIVVDSSERAARVLASLQGGADFEALAREHSTDPSAARGGDLGELSLSGLRVELQEALAGVAPGQISKVVRIPTGFAIFNVAAAVNEKGPAPPAVDTASPNPPQFAGVRYPPNMTGAFDVEAFFRALEKPAGWNTDLGTFCEIHREIVAIATLRLSELLDSGDPDLDKKMAPHDRVQAHGMWALMESYQGHMAAAIAQWEKAYRIALSGHRDAVPMLEETLAAAHFHKAELDNGLYVHPGEHCVFPPRPGAPYPPFAKTEDAERALGYAMKYLEKMPDDLEVKWLLNLIHMTLGTYPAGVPAEHRIPPELFASKGDMGRFVDVAPRAGLGGRPFMSGTMLVDDLDGDGRLDVATSSYDACDHIHFFHNRGDGTFENRSAPSRLTAVPGGQGLVQTDYNNDGCLDLLVLRGAWQVPMPVSLVKNGCDGTFTDVTREAGLRDHLYASQNAAWADIDNDGWLDVFIGNEQGPSRLFRNRGDGTFADISRAAGVERTAFVKGLVAEDYDNDGLPDFFIANIRGDNLLFRNKGDLAFEEVSQAAGVRQSFASFTTWFFDYDNDGWSDLFVASDYASIDEAIRTYVGRPRNLETSKLYRNTGRGTFEDVTASVGLDKVYMPMGANFGDADTDGFLDIYLGNGAPDYGSLAPNVLLRNAEAKAFVDVTAVSGTGELHKAHGVAFADVENRGHQDIVISMGGPVPADAHSIRLFRNPGNDNDWITVRLVGGKTNRAGLGARIELTVENQGRGVRRIYRTVTSGGSFGTSPLRQHIGLGKSAKVRELAVFWPTSGVRQVLKDVAPNRLLEIVEPAP